MGFINRADSFLFHIDMVLRTLETFCSKAKGFFVDDADVYLESQLCF